MPNSDIMDITNKKVRGNEMIKDRLKELRKEKKLTQSQLAKKLEVNQSTIAGIEIGRREPSNELMIKLSNFFNVSLDYLNGLSDSKNEDKEENLVKNLLIHLYDSGLIKDINNIDENTTNIIMGMVKKELELISKGKK